MNSYQFFIEEEFKNIRIDKFVSDNCSECTRSYAQKLIENGDVTVNGNKVKVSYKLNTDDCVLLTMPKVKELDARAEDITLDAVYEDGDMMVVNKPQGMVVHPAAGNYSGTLVNALLHHCGDELSGINGVARPGIVHRIDKDTSGLLLVAKNDKAHMELARQIKEHSLTREYIALVHGRLKTQKGTINAPIGRSLNDRKKMAVVYKNSRAATTHFEVLEHFPKYTLVKCRLETGRTHQIRVHMASKGHPVVGDKVYGVKKEEFKTEGQLLHACKLGFIHPTKGTYMEFYREVPSYFDKIFEGLRNSK